MLKYHAGSEFALSLPYYVHKLQLPNLGALFYLPSGSFY